MKTGWTAALALALALTWANLFIPGAGYCSDGMVASSWRNSVSLTRLYMGRKHKPPSVGNYPRKIKRLLHSAEVNSSRSLEELYNPRYESYLVNEASENMHKILMKKIQKTASVLNVKLKEGFGYRPPVELPTVYDYISMNPTTQVRNACCDECERQ
jgi:hypothetical protein